MDPINNTLFWQVIIPATPISRRMPISRVVTLPGPGADGEKLQPSWRLLCLIKSIAYRRGGFVAWESSCHKTNANDSMGASDNSIIRKYIHGRMQECRVNLRAHASY